MIPASARALLAGAIDYAGMFPPAGLGLEPAASNYADFARGEYAWALGRFVVAASRVAELERLGPLPPLAVVEAGCESCPGGATYVELDPAAADFEARAAGVKAAGRWAKLRTGGVRPEAIPSIELVARFLATCARLDLACKATAGLHHALRGEYPLTYAADAPRAVMHGFLNVMLAFACLRGGGEADARAVLALESGEELRLDDAGIAWGSHHWRLDQIAAARRLFTGFGSCSFEEPLQALAALTDRA